VHALLAWEEAAILELIEDWGPTDRSHRKLAHRGSYIGKVFVSPSSVRRVAAKHQVRLPEPPPRTPVVLPPWPEFVTWKPNCIWIWDGTEFRRARRQAFAIVDVVSRRWIHTVLTAEASSTQVQLLFAQALESEGLMAKLTPERLDLGVDDPSRPVLLAWSDNGPQMTSASTREFMALMAIWQYHGRPHTPTDQAHIVRPSQGRLAAPRGHRRPGRARSRAEPGSHRIQQSAPARWDRLRYPRRRALRSGTRHPAGPQAGASGGTEGTHQAEP